MLAPPLLYYLDLAALALLGVMALVPGRVGWVAACLGIPVAMAFFGLPLVLPPRPAPHPSTETSMADWPPPDASHDDITAFLEKAAMPPPPVTCVECGHLHAGPHLAGICIGCPCPHKGGKPPPAAALATPRDQP